MKLKESFVFILLLVAIVAVFGGFAFVSRGLTVGWAGVAVGVPVAVVVARSMRLRAAPGAAAVVAVKEDDVSASR
jgi:hypothetical protein